MAQIFLCESFLYPGCPSLYLSYLSSMLRRHLTKPAQLVNRVSREGARKLLGSPRLLGFSKWRALYLWGSLYVFSGSHLFHVSPKEGPLVQPWLPTRSLLDHEFVASTLLSLFSRSLSLNLSTLWSFLLKSGAAWLIKARAATAFTFGDSGPMELYLYNPL